MARNAHEEVLPVTTARGRLYDLVEEVITGRKTFVELSHRGYDEHVVLIRKGSFDKLRADNAALRARIGSDPRPLRGRGKLNVPADQVLARTRRRQAELALRKGADLVNAASDDD